jgi:hypothetical protein
MAEDTIEWGGAAPERRSWLGRLAAPPAARERLNYVALSGAIVGFVLVLAAEYLPWIHVDLNGVDDGNTNPATSEHIYDFPLGMVNTWQNMAYGLSVLLVLALIATLLVAAPPLRRLVAAAALGLLAGQASILVGLASSIEQGAGLGGAIEISSLPDNAVSVGPGFLVAVAALLVLAASVAVGVRSARSPRPQKTQNDPDAVDEPIDLVVTPLPAEPPLTGDPRADRP